MRVEEGDVQHGRRHCPPPTERTAHDIDERDDEHVRARERREERGDEAPDRIVLVAGVEDPVLRQSRQALVIQAELLAIPAGYPRVAPRLQRDECEVREPDDRHDDGRQGDQAADATPLLPGETSQAAERVRGDREEVMAKREELTSRGRPSAEHVLRDRPVDEDHDCVARREHVRGFHGREGGARARRRRGARRGGAPPSRRRPRRAWSRARRGPRAVPSPRCGGRARRQGLRSRSR